MVAAFNLALAKKGLTKVAMLPWFGPSPRFQYISDCLGIRKHDYLLVQGSDYRIAEPVITYKLIKCTLNKYWATWKPKPKPDIHPFYDLGPNEIERVAQYQYDWTRDWDFVYSVRIRNFPGPGGNWMAEGCMYFKGSLSPADYIPWNDPVKTMRVEADVLPVKYDNKTLKRRFTWKFCERSDNPRWGASFTIFYEEGTIIPTFDNPWFIFSSASTKL
ncbi:hypothetical protein IMZ48_31695 [Candidatus Bathyarchaeota archaeon]|nr:hypothetical protein [Candidatus Bathyarchaeota archaeon]